LVKTAETRRVSAIDDSAPEDERSQLIESIKQTQISVDALRVKALKTAVIKIVGEAETAHNALQIRELEAELGFYEGQLQDCKRRSEDAIRRLATPIDPVDSDAKAAVAAEDELDALEIQFNHSGMEQALVEADAEFIALSVLADKNAKRKAELERRRRRLERSKRHRAERAARALEAASSPDHHALLQGLKTRPTATPPMSRTRGSDSRSEVSARSRMTTTDRALSRIEKESRGLDNAEIQFAADREDSEGKWRAKMERLKELVAKANAIDLAELRYNNALNAVELGHAQLAALETKVELARLAQEEAQEKCRKLSDAQPVVSRTEALYARTAQISEAKQRLELRKARTGETVRIVGKTETETKNMQARNEATDARIVDLQQQIEAAMGTIEKEMRDWDMFNPPSRS
jgi:hypothetical protein